MIELYHFAIYHLAVLIIIHCTAGTEHTHTHTHTNTVKYTISLYYISVNVCPLPFPMCAIQFLPLLYTSLGSLFRSCGIFAHAHSFSTRLTIQYSIFDKWLFPVNCNLLHNRVNTGSLSMPRTFPFTAVIIILYVCERDLCVYSYYNSDNIYTHACTLLQTCMNNIQTGFVHDFVSSITRHYIWKKISEYYWKLTLCQTTEKKIDNYGY